MKKVFIFITSFLVSGLVAQSTPIDYQTIEIQPNTAFNIKLAENPTTGYQWEQATSDRLQYSEKKYRLPVITNGRIGASGTATFVFSKETVKKAMLRPGQELTFNFVYKKPWETKVGRNAKITVLVKK